MKQNSKPFFAKFLENQQSQQDAGHAIGGATTLKAPSDGDEAITAKAPSDAEDATIARGDLLMG
jgi:hypothetical protein